VTVTHQYRRRRRLTIRLWSPRLRAFASSGERVLTFSSCAYARAARDQWTQAGAHLGADWQVHVATGLASSEELARRLQGNTV